MRAFVLFEEVKKGYWDSFAYIVNFNYVVDLTEKVASLLGNAYLLSVSFS